MALDQRGMRTLFYMAVKPSRCESDAHIEMFTKAFACETREVRADDPEVTQSGQLLPCFSPDDSEVSDEGHLDQPGRDTDQDLKKELSFRHTCS